ncbi:hypothetical protein FGIG_11180 [Fasciola gigantica]|uniref:Oxidative stress-responsive serine-rich protein 1 n=1 Tax=Fasciola gigantica TaxID=46835 RepID=A0A504Z424_FASGI|nr:hypothetical protein FGIG_11180 [Fasciola gigantica]
MRVKRPKPDDLIDALKHLKIADRRSRLSLRGSLAILGSSSLEQTLRCRLTRSASSNSAGTQNYGALTTYPCDCCFAFGRRARHIEPIDASECSMCSRPSFRGSTQLAGGISPIPAANSDPIPPGSGFSPFTTSAGLLYSTLPTNLEFRRGHHPDLLCSQHVLQSDRLRRSCGAGLSHLDFDPVIYGPRTASTTQSRSSFGSATTSNSDRHHCCDHSGFPHFPPLAHLRLYRRLYSLIDHPCVSWHSASRPLRCPHRTSLQHSGSVLGKCKSHRHSLSLRHRHTTPGPATSQTSQRTGVPPVLPDLSSASLVLQDNVSQSDLTPVNYGRSIPEFPYTSSDPTSVDASQVPHYSDSASVYRSGCNSAVMDKNCPIPCLDHRRACLQSYTNRTPDVSNSSIMTTPQNSDSECLSSSNFSRCRRNSDPEQWQLIKSMRMCTADDSCHDSHLGDRGDTQLLCSRPVLNTQSGHGNATFGTRRSFLTRSLYTYDQSLCGDSSESSLPDESSRPVEPNRDSSSLLWTVTKRPAAVDGQSQLTIATKQTEDGDSMQSLQYEIALLDNTDSSNGGSHNRSHLTSDISVNELAAYMEHMVHIPGRMSEMAQRMYL